VISTRRFALAWVLVSVPLYWLINELLELWATPFSDEAWEQGRALLFWASLMAPALLGELAAALGQSFLLARFRRRVRGWIWAELVANGLYLGVFFGGWGPTAFFGKSLKNTLWSLAYTASWTLLLALARAVALWGRRWPPNWILWATGCLLLELVLAGTALGTDHRAAELARSVASAAGTAWLLDRAVFRPQEDPEPPRLDSP
jgi:hypothetical protein